METKEMLKIMEKDKSAHILNFQFFDSNTFWACIVYSDGGAPFESEMSMGELAKLFPGRVTDVIRGDGKGYRYERVKETGLEEHDQ